MKWVRPKIHLIEGCWERYALKKVFDGVIRGSTLGTGFRRGLVND